MSLLVYIETANAPAAIGPYGKEHDKVNEYLYELLIYLRIAQAIKVNGMVYTSGQIPLIPSTGT